MLIPFLCNNFQVQFEVELFNRDGQALRVPFAELVCFFASESVTDKRLWVHLKASFFLQDLVPTLRKTAIRSSRSKPCNGNWSLDLY